MDNTDLTSLWLQIVLYLFHPCRMGRYNLLYLLISFFCQSKLIVRYLGKIRFHHFHLPRRHVCFGIFSFSDRNFLFHLFERSRACSERWQKKQTNISFFFFFFSPQKILEHFNSIFHSSFPFLLCLTLFTRRIFIALPYRGNIIIDTCIIVTRTHTHTYTHIHTHVERISPSCRRLILTLFAKLLYPIRNTNIQVYKCVNYRYITVESPNSSKVFQQVIDRSLLEYETCVKYQILRGVG